MKKIITAVLIILTISSCRLFNIISSNTTIEPNKSFVLGDNKHGGFKVKIKNVCNHSLALYQKPSDNSKDSILIIKANATLTLNVNSNTALIIENKSAKIGSVYLTITGDNNLSMGYRGLSMGYQNIQ
jgi:hypothetical protein